MANALAVYGGIDVSGLDLTAQLYVVFSGVDVNLGQGDTGSINVTFAGTDTPNTIRQKISTAIKDLGASRGYLLDGASITIPTLQKGL